MLGVKEIQGVTKTVPHCESGGKKIHGSLQVHFNPFALGTAKTPYSFGHSVCNRVNARLGKFEWYIRT